MKKVYAFENRCLGCGLCEVYCKTSNSKSKDIIKAHKNENITSAITIEEIITPKAVSYFALQCRHCENPNCVKACISGAMYKNAEGVVEHDEERCVNCLSCVLTCPFGAVKQNVEGKTISKCGLCAQNQTPQCAANCPNDALKILDEAEAEALI
jgi:carbon-monoxide dehydrogenase iron sulfur subunit